MKASEIAEAYQLQQRIACSDALLDALPNEPLVIQVGTTALGVTLDDPQRILLDQAVRDFVAYSRREAEAKLAAFKLEPDLKPSEITGFPEDDLPPPEDPA